MRAPGVVATCLLAAWAAAARAGEIVSVTDPRTFERPVLPDADVKIVMFELTSVGKDEPGKARARELHDQLLARIRDVSGGAVVTFVTPPRKTIDTFKVDLQAIARAQKAQMVLWGSVLTDKSGKSLINARLTLVVPPRGIEAAYDTAAQAKAGAPPLALRGAIRGPVTETELSFSTLESNVEPLATFLSGLMRTYRADRAAGAASVPWLKKSAAEFERYAREMPEAGNGATIAAALLFSARAHVRIADAERGAKAAHLATAATELERAARLDPYHPGIPNAQAIVASRQGRPAKELRPLVAKAVSLAPADSDLRLNLALIDGARGDIPSAVRQAGNARYVHKAQQGTDFEAAAPVQKGLENYQQRYDIK